MGQFCSWHSTQVNYSNGGCVNLEVLKKADECDTPAWREQKGVLSPRPSTSLLKARGSLLGRLNGVQSDFIIATLLQISLTRGPQQKRDLCSRSNVGGHSRWIPWAPSVAVHLSDLGYCSICEAVTSFCCWTGFNIRDWRRATVERRVNITVAFWDVFLSSLTVCCLASQSRLQDHHSSVWNKNIYRCINSILKVNKIFFLFSALI